MGRPSLMLSTGFYISRYGSFSLEDVSVQPREITFSPLTYRSSPMQRENFQSNRRLTFWLQHCPTSQEVDGAFLTLWHVMLRGEKEGSSTDAEGLSTSGIIKVGSDGSDPA